MATSKTLSPTNVTISIPAMTDVPDASVFSNCVDKEADAINALNSNLAPQIISGVTWSVNINNSYTWFYKVGRIVFFQIFITDTITQSTSIGNLPSALIPENQCWFVGTASNGGDFTFRLIFNNQSGTLSVVLASPGASVAAPFISGVYIAQV